jgi:DNA-binding NarL/FixJ family response regulator
VLETVSKLLEGDFEVVGMARDGVSFVRMARRTKPDACVVDISMPRLSGIEASKQLLRHNPEARIVLLTVHEEPIYKEEAFALGALGYVLKRSLAQDLVPNLRSALAGERHLSSGSGGSPVSFRFKIPVLRSFETGKNPRMPRGS